jgi:surfeit locus 1 family protein
MPSRRQLLAALLGLAAAALFVRLGFWQLDRLKQRRIWNDVKLTRVIAPPVGPFNLIAGARQWRPVRAVGTFDFDHQVVIAGQSHEGAPGVYVITPFTVEPSGRVILVNRGWVYSPDAQTVDLAKFDEPPHQVLNGYVEEFVTAGGGPAHTASTANAWRRMDARGMQTAFPYPVAMFYIVAQRDSAAPPDPGAPVRLPPPSLDEGPHLNYAIQWFAFALIAIGGASLMIYRDRRTPG